MTAPENSSEDPTSRLSDSVRRALELASAERDGELSASESEELATLRLSAGRQVREFRSQAQKVAELVHAISLSLSEHDRDVIRREIMSSLRCGITARVAVQQEAVEQHDSAEFCDRVDDGSRNRKASVNEPILLRRNSSPIEKVSTAFPERERRKRSGVFAAAASFAAMFALLLVMFRNSDESDRARGSAERRVATTAGDVTLNGAMKNVMSEQAVAGPLAAQTMDLETRSLSRSELAATAELQAAEVEKSHEDWQVLVVRVSSTEPNLIHRRVQEIAAESGFLLSEPDVLQSDVPTEPSSNAGVNFGVVLKADVLQRYDGRLPSEVAEQAISSLETVETTGVRLSDRDNPDRENTVNEKRIHRFVQAIMSADIVENEEWNPARIGELTREETLEAVRSSLSHPGSLKSSLGEVYVAKLWAENAVTESTQDSDGDSRKSRPESQPKLLSEKALSHAPILIVFQID